MKSPDFGRFVLGGFAASGAMGSPSTAKPSRRLAPRSAPSPAVRARGEQTVAKEGMNGR